MIEQVDMEEIGGSGGGGARQEHARAGTAATSESCGDGSDCTGGGGGVGGGGGAGGGGNAPAAGWTDMFQGMSVEVRLVLHLSTRTSTAVLTLVQYYSKS